jgi:hypothetical protein
VGVGMIGAFGEHGTIETLGLEETVRLLLGDGLLEEEFQTPRGRALLGGDFRVRMGHGRWGHGLREFKRGFRQGFKQTTPLRGPDLHLFYRRIEGRFQALVRISAAGFAGRGGRRLGSLQSFVNEMILQPLRCYCMQVPIPGMEKE